MFLNHLRGNYPQLDGDVFPCHKLIAARVGAFAAVSG